MFLTPTTGAILRLVRIGIALTLQTINTKNYVGNLSFDMSEVELRSLFSEHGQVNEVALTMDRETNRPRGFAFVTMDTKIFAILWIVNFSGGGNSLCGFPFFLTI